jgi:hypothetical protein
MKDIIALQKKAQEDHDLLQTLIDSDIHTVLKKGKVLKELRDAQEYKMLGDGGYDTFESYLASPEIKMSRSYAWQHVQLYEYYVLEMSIPLIELVKFRSIQTMLFCLGIINKRALQGEDALELIEKAKVLSFTDFKKEVMDVEELPTDPTEATKAIDTGEIDLNDEFLKPATSRCDFCHKWKVEFHEQQICKCSGKPHVMNLDKGGGV